MLMHRRTPTSPRASRQQVWRCARSGPGRLPSRCHLCLGCVVGIDFHGGSQITQAGPYLDALERMLDLVQAIETAGVALAPGLWRRPGHQLQQGRAPPAAMRYGRNCWCGWTHAAGGRQLGSSPAALWWQRRGVASARCSTLKPGAPRTLHHGRRHERPAPPAMYQAYHGIVPLSPTTRRTPALMGKWSARVRKRRTGSAMSARWLCARATCWLCCLRARIA